MTGPGSRVGQEPLLIYGTATCEDTAVTRSRLRALGVPYREIDVDLDSRARDQLSELVGVETRPPTSSGS